MSKIPPENWEHGMQKTGIKNSKILDFEGCWIPEFFGTCTKNSSVIMEYYFKWFFIYVF